ncbi:MAG: delta-60 repeat domain-containing protein [Polyangiaceae bacterium]|nr:delta-60 repeat domain-containing protein [Polyangiaceae bacterium]
MGTSLPLVDRFPRILRVRRAACAALPIAALLVVGGCSTILGFDDTTLRPDDAGFDSETDVLPEAGDGATPSVAVDPTSLVLRRGGAHVTMNVTVNRNGVTGDLSATVDNLPPNVTASGLTLPAGQDSGTIEMWADASANLGPYTAKLVFPDALLPEISVGILVADAAGSLDSTFGEKGVASDTSHGTSSAFYALALEPGGSILAGGAIGNDLLPLGDGWLLQRFSSDGNVDETFAPEPPQDGKLRAIAVDANGKIVCVGSSTPTGELLEQITVVRFNPNGTPDMTFGTDGMNRPLIEGALGSDGLAVATLADGSILVSGTVHDGTDSGFIVRLSSSGENDPTFNGGNPLVVPSHQFVGVAPAAAGAIVVGGTSGSGLFSLFSVARFEADGSTDSLFGNNGELTFGSVGYEAFGFTATSDGSLVLAGSIGGSSYTAGKATPDGVQQWVRAVANSAGAASFNAVAAETNGLIVAAGSNTATGEARVTRLAANGMIDNTFGNSGSSFITQAASPVTATLNAIVLQQDGRIVVAGNRSDLGATIFRIWH